jgi:LmbE family N-acetylglucosaminyl deacetylase
MPGATASPRRILAVFAHPDDELSVGSTLARYADSGVDITLICATRGEAATIYSPPEYGATRANLGQVRTRELECCCAILGIADLRWLDWPDGGVASVDRDLGTGEVVKIIREVRPQVMITHPDHGGYPHPDHLAVHDIVLAAWQAAANSAHRSDLGPAHAVAKLYGRVIPLSFFRQAPEFAEYRVQLNGDQLPFVPTPDDEIGTVLDVAAWAGRRAAGWDCHASQHNPNGAFSQVPDDVQQDYRNREYLQLIAHRLTSDPAHETDLFAGIEPMTEIEQDEPEVPLARGRAAEALATRLQEGLRATRAYLLIYQDYRKRARKEDFIELLDVLIDESQEAIAMLSAALRRLDRSPMHAGVHEKVLAQGASRKGTSSKLNFMIVGQERLMHWAGEQLHRKDTPEITALWQHLADMSTRHREATKALLGLVEKDAQIVEDD